MAVAIAPKRLGQLGCRLEARHPGERRRGGDDREDADVRADIEDLGRVTERDRGQERGHGLGLVARDAALLEEARDVRPPGSFDGDRWWAPRPAGRPRPRPGGGTGIASENRRTVGVQPTSRAGRSRRQHALHGLREATRHGPGKAQQAGHAVDDTDGRAISGGGAASCRSASGCSG